MSGNIAEAFVCTVSENLSRTAVIDARTGESITFEGLDSRADACALFLQRHGVLPGEIVSLMVRPGIDFIAITLALFKLGTPVVLIDPGMGYRNLLRCIERVAPKYLIGIPKACLFAMAARSAFASVEQKFCLGPALFGFPGRRLSLQPEEGQEAFPVYRPMADDLAAVIFTTGSTGPPKGVRYEHSIFAAQLQMIREYYHIGADDIDQPAFPLFALFSTALGACAVIPDMDPTRPAQVDPVKFTESIRRYGVTYSFGSPAIWNVITRWSLEKGVVLESLRKVLMAGAPVSPELIGRVKQLMAAGGEVHTPYGATESLPIVSIEGDEVLAETAEKSLAGAGICVGRALPGIALRVIAISDAPIDHISATRQCSTGEIGEIIVQGSVVTRGYLNNEAETRLAKIPGESGTFWHRMGDTGCFDDQGRLWFCGRRAHRVVGEGVDGYGQTWFSIPCEAVVNHHEHVLRSALVGVSGADNVKIPVLVLEPLEGAAQEHLVEEVRALAAASPITREIELFLIFPGPFPVDIRHNAKIFREKIAVWAQQKLYPHT